MVQRTVHESCFGGQRQSTNPVGLGLEEEEEEGEKEKGIKLARAWELRSTYLGKRRLVIPSLVPRENEMFTQNPQSLRFVQ